MSISKLLLETQELLGRLHEETASAEEKKRFLVGLNALRFISDLGQPYELETIFQKRGLSIAGTAG
jgi:hypothetical protein